MTTVSNSRPVAVAKPAATAPAATGTPAKPAAPRPAGDVLALSASAKATAPEKTVVIDGKEYALRETGKRKWKAWEKVTTFGLTGVGGVMSLMASVAMAAPMSPTGAMSGAIWAVIIGGTAIGTAISYGGGRLVSNVFRGVGGLFDGK